MGYRDIYMGFRIKPVKVISGQQGMQYNTWNLLHHWD